MGNLLNNRLFGEPSPSAFFPRSVRSVTNPPNTFRRHWQGLQCLWLWRVVCEALRSSIRASTLRPCPKKRGRSILQAKPCTARKVALNAGCCGTPIPLCQFFQEWRWIQRWSWSIGWNLEIFSCSTHVCGIARHHGQGPKLSWACSRPLPHPHISHMIHQCGRILFYPGVWTRDLKTKRLLCSLSMFFSWFLDTCGIFPIGNNRGRDEGSRFYSAFLKQSPGWGRWWQPLLSLCLSRGQASKGRLDLDLQTTAIAIDTASARCVLYFQLVSCTDERHPTKALFLLQELRFWWYWTPCCGTQLPTYSKYL